MSVEGEFDNDSGPDTGPTGRAVVVCGRDGLTSTRWFSSVAEAEAVLGVPCERPDCTQHTLVHRDPTGRWRVRSSGQRVAPALPPGHALAESAAPRPTPAPPAEIALPATTAAPTPEHATVLTAPTPAQRVCFRGHELPEVKLRGERCEECQSRNPRRKNRKGKSK
jgi:hypothetical protein